MQVDVVIDEFYTYDPTTYNLTSFMTTYNITSNMTAANASFPFLRNAAVYRYVPVFAYDILSFACVVLYLVGVCFSHNLLYSSPHHVHLLARTSKSLVRLFSLPWSYATNNVFGQ